MGRTIFTSEPFLFILILVLFYIGGWFLISPSFKNVEDYVHNRNSTSFIRIATTYIHAENVILSEGETITITLKELREAGYIKNRDERFDYITLFSRADHTYADDSTIYIVKKDNRLHFSIRLCPHKVAVCDEKRRSLLDTTV